MAYINENYLKLQAGYLFPEIARRVSAWQAESSPEMVARLIRCGIGDVTEGVPQAALEAMIEATKELANRNTFHGYGPEQGYEFLRKAIVEGHYAPRGCEIEADDIFISDGSKCDTGNILDIFGRGNRVGVPDPVYPVYVDTNVMAGNTGEIRAEGGYAGLHYLKGDASNNFVPQPPDVPLDIVYLCFPNNPTGATATREDLQAWVDYARNAGTVILFDAAYAAFIRDPEVPQSIYEIPGATECAIEFRSFSKDGGFTGLRCAYTTIPRQVMAKTQAGLQVPLRTLWARRQTTKFNGVAYPIQRAAAALFSPEGKQQVAGLIEYYSENARILGQAVRECGLEVFGGVNAPYVWVRCPQGLDSWQTFDLLLNQAQVVITPGSGFGAAGEGFFRISSFNSRDNVLEVARRLKELLGA